MPMIPDIEGENDTSYFEEYDDEDEHVEHVRCLVHTRTRVHTRATATRERRNFPCCVYVRADLCDRVPASLQISAEDQEKFSDF